MSILSLTLMLLLCHFDMCMLMYRLVRTGWKIRPRPKTVILELSVLSGCSFGWRLMCIMHISNINNVNNVM